ncbi:MAG: DUF2797 domain-containing protein [Crocinitomicaceae bacterium]|nr:DUF2797 domain-containing protein [Crocinitomicaceae bacterium]
MRTKLEEKVQYNLVSDEVDIDMNALIGSKIKLKYEGVTQCMSCNKYKKLFAQGICFDCFNTSAMASPCILRPELCEGHLGKGRDIEWEKANHVQPHVVYFAVASGLKVGVTRETQVPTRWIDQGASYAIKIAETPYRQLAGELEVALKGSFTDKTNWQRMLKNEIADYDLVEEKWELEGLLPMDLVDYMSEDDEITEINYPVLAFPDKVKSVNLDKVPEVEQQLLGIKGQYLIFDDNKVLNVRKFEGYHVEIDMD